MLLFRSGDVDVIFSMNHISIDHSHIGKAFYLRLSAETKISADFPLRDHDEYENKSSN